MSSATRADVPGHVGSGSHRTVLLRRPGFWLAVVAVVHAVAPLWVLGLHWPLGSDETVYLSQLNRHTEALYFSAPRARGSTLIAAPITLLTSSLAAVRLWVSALSGIGLWLGFRPWLRVIRGWVTPTAAAAFATLWVVTLYGFEVMPNEWVAFATLAACGLLLRWCDDGRRRHLIVAALALAIIGLLRPSDAGFALLGLGAPVLFLRRPWRARSSAVLALVLGFVAGVAEWLIEAETAYGGIPRRVHHAQAEQGGSGLFWTGPAQARVLAGPLLCRTGCHANAGYQYRAWWVVGAVLLIVAAVTAVRARSRFLLLPLVCGVIVAAQYLFTVPYAAPRFLLPAYALFSIPATVGAGQLIRLLPGHPLRRLAIAGCVALLAAQVVLQVQVMTRYLKPTNYASAAVIRTQARLLIRDGLRRPCAVVGSVTNNYPLSYRLGCINQPMSAHQTDARLAAGGTIVLVQPARPTHPSHVHWRRIALPGAHARAWLSVRPGHAG